MRCRKCGAELLDTDTFCVNCGQKVEEMMRCPNCGEKLREEEKFCHKCGTMVSAQPEDEEIPIVKQNTVDIPFDMIEQGILLQAEQAIVKRPDRERPEAYERPSSGKERPEAYERPPLERERPEAYERPPLERERPEAYRRPSSEKERPEAYKRPSMEKRPSRQRPVSHRADYEDYDEEDREDSKLKTLTIVFGIIIIAVILAVVYIVWSKNSPSRYERPENEVQQEGNAGDGGEGQAAEGGEGNPSEIQGRLQILSNVNVRNKPSTDDSDVLMVAKKGETYQYYEIIDDAWYHIELEDGTDGYVYSEYVEDLE